MVCKVLTRFSLGISYCWVWVVDFIICQLVKVWSSKVCSSSVEILTSNWGGKASPVRLSCSLILELITRQTIPFSRIPCFISCSFWMNDSLESMCSKAETASIKSYLLGEIVYASIGLTIPFIDDDTLYFFALIFSFSIASSRISMQSMLQDIFG